MAETNVPISTDLPPAAKPHSVPKLTIFCDGSNFLPSLREAGIAYEVDVPRLAKVLARSCGGHILNKLKYYTAPTPNQGGETSRRQQVFFESLRNSSSTNLILGRHEKRGTIHVEKETDVRMTVDMLMGAFSNEFEVAMVLTGDTDFVPAVNAIKRLGKRVIWCHFPAQRHSDELRQIADQCFELSEKVLRTCRRSRT